jgi:acetyl/propionyl-CoA carboxylase alpha subunit
VRRGAGVSPRPARPLALRPATGTLTSYQIPAGEGIRVDGGYTEGMAIPVYYDPMIAKLITHGNNRTEAIQKMKSAIAAYKIEGVQTTLPFGTFVLEHEAFLTGQFDTQFVQKYFSPEQLLVKQKSKAELAALIALRYWLEKQKEVKAVETVQTNWTKRSQ